MARIIEPDGAGSDLRFAAAPVSDLLARATGRRAVPPGDGRSGAAFERVSIDGQGYFLKRLSPASDWLMRVTGDFDGFCAGLRSKGVTFSLEPTDFNPTTRIAFIQAPDGVSIELLNRKDQP